MKILILILTFSLFSSGLVVASDWQHEFEELCANLQDADALTTEELKSIIGRIDKILPEIQASDDPSAKVYIFRIQKCRSFYEFSLDSRQGP